jgi:hypothetical protein
MGRSRATSLDHWGGPGGVTSKGLLVAVALVGCTRVDPSTKVFADAATTGVVRPQLARFDAFLVAFGTAQQAVLTEERDPSAAAARACAAMNKANAQ